MFQPNTVDFSRNKTFTAKDRHNLVRIDNLRTPGAQNDDLFHSEEFDILLEKLKEAKAEGRTITCFIGASTGIQTAYQMQWLKEEVEKASQGKERRGRCHHR